MARRGLAVERRRPSCRAAPRPARGCRACRTRTAARPWPRTPTPTGRAASSGRPSSVVIDAPATFASDRLQLTTALPSTSTVQHPHWPDGEQPSLGEHTPSSSRSAASRCGCASETETSAPLSDEGDHYRLASSPLRHAMSTRDHCILVKSASRLERTVPNAEPLIFVNPGPSRARAGRAPRSAGGLAHRRSSPPSRLRTRHRVVDAPGLAAELGLAAVSVKDESQPARPAVVQDPRRVVGRVPAARRRGSAHEPEWHDLAELRAALAPLGPLTLVAATDGNHGRAVAHMARLLGYASQIFVPAGTAAARITAIESEGALGDGGRRHLRRRGARVGRARHRRRARRVGHVVGGLHRGAAHGDRGLQHDLRRGRRATRRCTARRRRGADGCRRARGRRGRALRRHRRRSSRSSRSPPRAGCDRPRPGIRCWCPGRTTRSWPGSTAARCRSSRGPLCRPVSTSSSRSTTPAAEHAMRDLAGIGVVAGETGAAALAGLRAVVESGALDSDRPAGAGVVHRRCDRPGRIRTDRRARTAGPGRAVTK